MSVRKTAIDKAIEQREGEMRVVELALAKLKAQREKPKSSITIKKKALNASGAAVEAAS